MKGTKRIHSIHREDILKHREELHKRRKDLEKRVHNAHIWDFIKDMIFINLGMGVYSLGWAVFMLPNRITTGGGAGAAAILQYATGFPMQYTLLIVNAGLLLLAWWQLGPKFTLKTLYAVLSLSFYLGWGQYLVGLNPALHAGVLGHGQEIGISCILGAVLNGIGIGMVFTSGGCTGGWDIIASVINKHKNVSIGRVLLYLDLVVIGSCYFIFRGRYGDASALRMVVYGYVTLFVYTFAVDAMINSSKLDLQFTVYTREYDEMVETIRKKTGHTATLLDGEGGYTGEAMKVLITIVHKHEQVQVMRLIRDVDPDAFVTVHRVEGAFGKGFNVIKA